ARDVYIGRHRYQHTPIDRLLAKLLEAIDRGAVPRKTMPAHAPSDQLSPEVLERPADGEPIAVRHVIGALNDFLSSHVETPVVVDTGDCLFAAVDIRANEIVGPGYYATMGFAVPAALGVEIASGKRPIVLVGDGAFQMTGPEISHAPLYGCRPVVVVLNNT